MDLPGVLTDQSGGVKNRKQREETVSVTSVDHLSQMSFMQSIKKKTRCKKDYYAVLTFKKPYQLTNVSLHPMYFFNIRCPGYF